MSERNRQILLGVAGGAASAVLTLWLRVYMPATDSFADMRDAPAILLAFFAGPVPALVAGTLAAVVRAAVCSGELGRAAAVLETRALLALGRKADASRRWQRYIESAKGRSRTWVASPKKGAGA